MNIYFVNLPKSHSDLSMFRLVKKSSDKTISHKIFKKRVKDTIPINAAKKFFSMIRDSHKTEIENDMPFAIKNVVSKKIYTYYAIWDGCNHHIKSIKKKEHLPKQIEPPKIPKSMHTYDPTYDISMLTLETYTISQISKFKQNRLG